MIGTLLDDRDVDLRQRQLSRQHHPRRTASGDHHRMLGHTPPLLFSVGSGSGRRFCAPTGALPQAPGARYIEVAGRAVRYGRSCAERVGPRAARARSAISGVATDRVASPLTRYRGPVSSPRVPGGVVHKLPGDLREALIANPTALDAWKDITPLARNEFICWVEDAKQEMTRERRIRRTKEELEEGQRRPCCWPGCKHRERTGK